MRIWLAIALAGASAAGACGKGKAAAVALDERAMAELQDQAMGAPFAEAARRAEERLGPPRAKDGVAWEYAVVQGDTCFQLGLMRSANGDKVAGVQNSATRKGQPMYDECQKLAAAPAAR